MGKTALAVKLAGRIAGEIISADSMQVYRGMRILSQAPAPADRKSARHHLIAFIDPSKEYSAACFIKDASRKVKQIVARGNIPIVAGGTGLYVKALIDGLFQSPEADLKFREKMQAFVSKYGSPRLHEKLKNLDPEAAKAIHPNDARRIIRALEVHESTGKTMTELKSRTKGLKDDYRIKMIGITAPREKIYDRINSRVEKMFAQGLVGEVRRLRKKRLSKTAKAALGIKEVSGYIDGEYDLETAKDMLKMRTRRFAKRQLTWFRADKRIKWNARYS